jgi:hypothetical protein
MAAGFKSDIKRASPGGVSGGRQRMNLGMSLPIALVPTLAYHAVVAHDHGTDEGIRLDVTTPALGQLQGALHPGLVGR